jgi:uncharacterized protein (TIGR03435 family)
MNAHIATDNSRLDYFGIPLRLILLQAFGPLRSDQLVGPDWLANLYFDIHATFPDGSSNEQAPAMLQTLLAGRFGLLYHREQRLTPVYKLKAIRGAALPPAKDDIPGRPPQFSGRGGKYLCEDCPMSTLASALNALVARQPAGAFDLNRIVIDATGIEGKYDLTLNLGTSTGSGAGADVPDESRTIAQALKDLGLLLEPDKVQFDYIVIDRMMKEPTGN